MEIVEQPLSKVSSPFPFKERGKGGEVNKHSHTGGRLATSISGFFSPPGDKFAVWQP
jgi:hypothetical protein